MISSLVYYQLNKSKGKCWNYLKVFVFTEFYSSKVFILLRLISVYCDEKIVAYIDDSILSTEYHFALHEFLKNHYLFRLHSMYDNIQWTILIHFLTYFLLSGHLISVFSIIIYIYMVIVQYPRQFSGPPRSIKNPCSATLCAWWFNNTTWFVHYYYPLNINI